MTIEEKLKSIKALFLDVDNTALCLKMYDNDGINDQEHGKRIVGVKDDKEWMAYNICNNAYKYCEAPIPLYNLVEYVRNNGGKIYGLTECSNSFEYNSKFNRLRECYPGSFLHHGELISVHTRHDKVFVMKTIADRDNLDLGEIMFVDDSYLEVMESSCEGIFGMHTLEAMMRFDDMSDMSTNGIKIDAYTENIQ